MNRAAGNKKDPSLDVAGRGDNPRIPSGVSSDGSFSDSVPETGPAVNPKMQEKRRKSSMPLPAGTKTAFNLKDGKNSGIYTNGEASFLTDGGLAIPVDDTQIFYAQEKLSAERADDGGKLANMVLDMARQAETVNVKRADTASPTAGLRETQHTSEMGPAPNESVLHSAQEYNPKMQEKRRREVQGLF